jgi:hypothetical protein
MRRGVVEHDVHVEVRGHRAVDQVQEATEFLGPMARRGIGAHPAGGAIQRGVSASVGRITGR